MWVWLVASFAFIGLAVLVSAGTLNYWQAWAYLVVGAASGVPLLLRLLWCVGVTVVSRISAVL